MPQLILGPRNKRGKFREGEMKRIDKIVFAFVVVSVLCFSSFTLSADDSIVFDHYVSPKLYFSNTTGNTYGEVGVSNILF